MKESYKEPMELEEVKMQQKTPQDDITNEEWEMIENMEKHV